MATYKTSDEEKDKQVLEQVQQRFAIAENNQKTIFDKYIEYYEYYRGSKTLSQTWKSQLFVPYVKQTIDTILPRLVSQKPKLNILPREDGDQESAQIYEKLIDYQWYKLRMLEKTKLWAKNGLIYGNSIIKLGWDYSEDKDGIWAEVISPYDFFIDPSATDIDDAGYVIFKQERDLADLKKNKNYKNLDKLEQAISSYSSEHKLQEKGSLNRNTPGKDKRKKIVVYEYYGRFAEKEDESEKDYLIVTANNEFVLRVTPLEEVYPCGKPFVCFKDDPMPLDFWAIGEVEPLISLQDELNTMRNQRLDNRKLILNPMWLFDVNAGVDPQDLISRPGGLIGTQNVQGLQPLPVNDTTGNSVQEEAIIKQDMDRTSGVFQGMMGQLQNPVGAGATTNSTARGFLASIEQAGTRMQYKLDNLENALVKLGEKIIKLNQKYIKKDQVIRIVGKGGVKFETVPVDVISKEYDLMVEGGSTQPQNKEAQRNNIISVLQTILPLAGAPMFNYEPGGQPTPTQVNLKYYLDRLLDTFDLPSKEEAFIEQPQQPLMLPQEYGQPAQSQPVAEYGQLPPM